VEPGALEPITALIFDLDGLLLDTESLCLEVGRQVLSRHSATLTKEAAAVALGKRPLDCWSDVAQVLGLQVPAQQLLDESELLLRARWGEALA
jgi:beta-phosphoglucomutase-like phosphatase (HAD superfamily)